MFTNPTVYRNFIDENLHGHLKNYAYSLYDKKLFTKNLLGPNRFYFMVDKNPDYFSDEIKNLFYKIADFIKIDKPVLDPTLGIIISIIKPGGFIHDHTDAYTHPKLRNNHNVRFNIMIERDTDISYNPVIEDKNIDVNIMDAWCFSASHMRHRTNKITGDKDRLVYQFGFCV